MTTQMGTPFSETKGLTAGAELFERDAVNEVQSALLGTTVHPKSVNGSEALEKPESKEPQSQDGVEATTGVDDEPEEDLYNDAIFLGDENSEMDELLAKPATFLTGEMWGAKDRRNTQDGKWKAHTLPWGAWIHGGDGGKGASAWGFSRHPVNKHKEGRCIVLGSSVEGARKANAMDEMYALGLDIDSGAGLDEVANKILEKGLFALVYTTHSHGKTGLEIQRDDIMRKLSLTSDPTLPQVQEYLREHSKSRYEKAFISRVRIEDDKRQTSSGVKIVLSTPPLDKFRVIFPMQKPVKLIDLAATQQAALEVWEDKVTGMAVEALGVNFDTACTDPSRLFYTARHADDSEWDCMIIRGAPLKFEDVPTFKKHLYTKHRGKLNPFELAGGDEGEKVKEYYTPSGKSLNDWHRQAKDRFQLAMLLEDCVPDKIRHAGGEAEGHVHTECPFEHEHSSEGGTACMAVDSLDSASEYWTWFCHHDACQNRHKLEFLAEALEQGWIEEEVLFDESSIYFLDPGEEVETEEVVEVECEAIEQRARQFDKITRANKIEDFLSEIFQKGIDATDRARVTEILAEVTVLGKRDINKMWQKLDRVQARIEKDKAKSDASKSEAILVDEDFRTQCEKALYKLDEANEIAPFLFERMDSYCTIHHRDNVTSAKVLSGLGAFEHLLNLHVEFRKRKGDDGAVGVAAPKEVASHLYHAEKTRLPALDGVASIPFFAPSGALVRDKGYHAETRTYFEPGSFVVLPVAPAPTLEEAKGAMHVLVREFADFPIGGLTRVEIEERFWDKQGIPSMVHAMSDLFLPFMRATIDGPTPGHIYNKPAPGTGATLLCDLFSIISTGAVTPPIVPPKNPEEMGKTVAAALKEAPSRMFFDNANDKIDSGPLASAMTSKVFSARILGKTEQMRAEVRCTWSFTANKMAMSDELVRRCVLIDLNAGMDDPSQRDVRKMLRHNIKGYIEENRAQLAQACLTVIQYWVSQGMPEQDDINLGSYEVWSRKMGGLWKSLGVSGFLGNEDKKKGDLSDGERDVQREFIAALAQCALDRKDPRADGRYSVYAKDNADRSFVSVIETLNSFADEPIRFPGWKYQENSEGAVTYNDARAVGTKFKSMVWETTFTVPLMTGPDNNEGTRRATERYNVTFECGKDRNSTNVHYMSIEPA